jgi:hypothetical protein
MRNVSRNKFSRLVIKKSPYTGSVTVMKSTISGVKTSPLHTIIKPTKDITAYKEYMPER